MLAQSKFIAGFGLKQQVASPATKIAAPSRQAYEASQAESSLQGNPDLLVNVGPTSHLVRNTLKSLWTPSELTNTNVDDVHTVSQESFPSHPQLVSEALQSAGYSRSRATRQCMLSTSHSRLVALTYVVPETRNFQ
jgi:hypothetical protein